MMQLELDEATPVLDWRVNEADRAEVIRVGDRVRSYDWEYDTLSYVEGEVLRIGPVKWDRRVPRYTIRADLWVVRGKTRRLGVDPTFYPPVNGTPHAFGGFCNGVRKIEEQDDE